MQYQQKNIANIKKYMKNKNNLYKRKLENKK